MGEIVSVEKAKDYLGLGSGANIDDSRLQVILAGAESQVTEYVAQTKLVIETGLTQKFVGGRGRLWFLDFRPIVSITSIVDPNSNTIEAEFYQIIEEEGLIAHRRNPPFGKNAASQAERWTVTYSAGQFTTADEIPDSVTQAILLLAARRFHRVEPGVQSVRNLSTGTAYIPNPTNAIMPAECIELLTPFVRRGV